MGVTPSEARFRVAMSRVENLRVTRIAKTPQPPHGTIKAQRDLCGRAPGQQVSKSTRTRVGRSIHA